MENEYQLVSIDEMREMAKSENYSLNEDELKFEEWSGNDLKCAIHIEWWKPNLLRDHLLLEECMSRDDIDWKFTTHTYDFRMIAYLRYLWYNPLVWVPIPDDFKNKRIIAGRVAEERYVRRDDYLEYGTPISQNFGLEMLNWFVHKMPKFDGSELTDVFEANYVIPDMCLWHYLTTDDSRLRISIMQGGAFNLSLLQLFSPHIFVHNMKQIAECYGGEKAAEILQLFRKDWQRLFTLKLFNLNKLTPDQIEDFRACLFEGMDYYLEQWETENVPQNETKDKTACFPLITEQCQKEGKLNSVDTEIRAACHGTAVGLWKTLRTNAALDYIEPLETWNAAELYRTIEHYYGELPFKERNFREARNKK